MNSSRSFCPQCKNDVTFIRTAHSGGFQITCPTCGAQYDVSEERVPVASVALSGAMTVLGVLFRVFLVIVALGLIGLAVLYASCALPSRGF